MLVITAMISCVSACGHAVPATDTAHNTLLNHKVQLHSDPCRKNDVRNEELLLFMDMPVIVSEMSCLYKSRYSLPVKMSKASSRELPHETTLSSGETL
jgi:hypothetical protein